MFADFQEIGKEHCCIDILKSFVRDGVIAHLLLLSCWVYRELMYTLPH